MKYKIKYEKKCLKYLRKIDKNTQLRIIRAINKLPLGDVRRLQGSTANYRLRVGNYRIIFSKDDEKFVIFVVGIGSRGKIYDIY
jgi:mRNA interferase RelE/StbE